MSTATPSAHDWHCEAHETYGWRGEECRKCPVTPSEITTLREQVEKLTKELDEWKNDAINGGNAGYLREQLAALAEQNTKLKEAINLIYSWANNWDSEFMNDPDWQEKDYPFIQSAISLPSLATPVLNRIKAEAYREAAEIVGPEDSYQDDWFKAKADSCAKLRAKADELEQSK